MKEAPPTGAAPPPGDVDGQRGGGHDGGAPQNPGVPFVTYSAQLRQHVLLLYFRSFERLRLPNPPVTKRPRLPLPRQTAPLVQKGWLWVFLTKPGGPRR